MKQALTDMYNAPDLQEALRRKENVLAQFDQTAPKATTLLDESFVDIPAVFSLPEAYRKRLRTSNGIERLNEELRRRERVIRIFPNEGSLIWLMGAVLMELHEKWLSGKRYFNMHPYNEAKAARVTIDPN